MNDRKFKKRREVLVRSISLTSPVCIEARIGSCHAYVR